jgi:hypothetical protein
MKIWIDGTMIEEKPKLFSAVIGIGFYPPPPSAYSARIRTDLYSLSVFLLSVHKKKIESGTTKWP